jgi:hypothetical protein
MGGEPANTRKTPESELYCKAKANPDFLLKAPFRRTPIQDIITRS